MVIHSNSYEWSGSPKPRNLVLVLVGLARFELAVTTCLSIPSPSSDYTGLTFSLSATAPCRSDERLMGDS